MKSTIKSVPVIALILISAAKVGAQVPSLFVTSESCMACHNGLVTPAGEDVSIGVGWRGSMMANAARDPYWHAAVRRETLGPPDRLGRDPERVLGLPHADGALPGQGRRTAGRGLRPPARLSHQR